MKALIILALCSVALTFAQPSEPDMNVFAQRRKAFMDKMQPGSVAIFPCKPKYLRNLDVEYEYRQESNLYYLSGFEEPESIVFMNPGEPKHKYTLFVRRKDLSR